MADYTQKANLVIPEVIADLEAALAATRKDARAD